MVKQNTNILFIFTVCFINSPLSPSLSPITLISSLFFFSFSSFSVLILSFNPSPSLVPLFPFFSFFLSIFPWIKGLMWWYMGLMWWSLWVWCGLDVVAEMLVWWQMRLHVHGFLAWFAATRLAWVWWWIWLWVSLYLLFVVVEGFRGGGDGWLMVVVANVGLWCRGGGRQRAVGMVVADMGLFDYFLMSL